MLHPIPSQLLGRAVEEFAGLPGIGRKTAMRLVLHLLRKDKGDVERFTGALMRLINEVRQCTVCRGISDTEVCPICGNRMRDHGTVCVVENVQDVMAIEATQQYRGVYHVLGGVISPLDGIGPNDIEIASLVKRVQAGDVKELIFALSPTMEGDTTCFYIYRMLGTIPLTITTLARGIAQNDELQYTDEVTLGRSIIGRQPFTGK